MRELLEVIQYRGDRLQFETEKYLLRTVYFYSTHNYIFTGPRLKNVKNFHNKIGVGIGVGKREMGGSHYTLEF